MGLETATKPSELVLTNPVSSDLRSQGDDHIRLVKTVVQNLGKWAGLEVQTADSSTSISAVAGKLYICTGGTAVTVTLPASPSVGDTVAMMFTNGLATNVVARNSSNIGALAENCTINSGALCVWRFQYMDSTRGWCLT